MRISDWSADVCSSDLFVRGVLVRELARAAGPAGMAGGQMMDLAAETADFDLPTVTRLQQLKTGALIGFSVEAGAILASIPAEGRGPLRSEEHTSELQSLKGISYAVF